MNKLQKIVIGLAAFYLFLLAFGFAWTRVFGQTPPQSLTTVVYTNINSASTLDGCDAVDSDPCIDNRSQFTRQSSMSSFRAFGTGSWSVTMQYADVTPIVWTSFGSTAVVTQAGPSSGIGFGIGPGSIQKSYHDFIRFVITGNATIMNYSGTRQFWWLPAVASIAFPLTANQGGTYGAFYVDQFGSPLSTVCSTASGLGLTVLVTQLWPSQSTEDLSSCSLTFTSTGQIQAAANQTITLNPNFVCPPYQQCFDVTTNSGATVAFSGTAPVLNPNWFGADWTGSAESLPAFNAAKASSGNLHLVAGTYNFKNGGSSSTWYYNMTVSGQSLRCDPGAKIESTGGTAVDSVIYLSGDVFNQVLDGCTIVGNANVTNEVHLNGNAQSSLTNLILYNTAGTGNCLQMQGGNTNTVQRITCSGVYQSPHPADTGIYLNSEGLGDQYVGNRLEQLTYGYRGSSLGNVFIGGTSEGNITCWSFSGGFNNTIENVDQETCTTADVADGNAYDHFLNVNMGTLLHLTSTAYKTVVESGGLGGLTIDSGAKFNQIRNLNYDNGGAQTISDSGTNTSIMNVHDANGGALYVQTFTPTLNFCSGAIPSTCADTGNVYANQTGTYSFDGQTITAQIFLQLSTLGSATGSAAIGGLPIASGGLAASGTVGYAQAISISPAAQPMIRIDTGSTYLQLTQWNSAGSATAISNSAFANSSLIELTITYHI